MKSSNARFLLLAAMLYAVPAFGQEKRRDPHIGYAYPAGGQQGTTFKILVGGQNLGGVRDVHVSGTGVKATVVKSFRPLGNINGDERKAIQNRMRELFAARLAELPAEVRSRIPLDREFPGLRKEPGATRPGKGKDAQADTVDVKLPDTPLLTDLDKKSLRELLSVRDELLGFRKRQQNAQIAESVLIEVTIDSNAAIGDRDLRLSSGQGVTNPLCFQVASFPETREEETNDPGAFPFLPPQQASELPVVINGQIKPGDVDRVAFRAHRGQKLVIQTFARHLVPYLADAVPGWFQATVALFDSHDKEVAFADDYRFDPDPVLYFEVPEDGQYELEIRDSIFRGRDDFVYRIAIAEQPFITGMFPLGGRTGSRTLASIEGWNLNVDELRLATPPGLAGPRQVTLKQQQQVSNPVTYSVDMLPECTEVEPNDSTASAQAIELPKIVNGRIEKPGDADVFSFQGRAGQEIVAEVWARRLQSPLDSLVQLMDSTGRVLAWNDDVEQLAQKESGLLTHHSDSYLRARIPENGTCYIRLTDAQQHAGEAYSYRLRISPPRPDFALRATPSSLSMQPGWAAPICVYALRKDGFDGDIEIALKNDATGFTLAGARIPRGQNRVNMTVTAPLSREAQMVSLELEGVAHIAGQTIRRKVVPADDMEQAFAYRHLVPAQELMAHLAAGRRSAPPPELDLHGPVRIGTGGTAEIRIKAPPHPRLPEVRFELRDPPAGITLEKTRQFGQGLVLTLKAAPDAPPGTTQNLLVEAFVNPPTSQPAGGKPKNAPQRISLGLLPAIPLEIVKR